MLGRPLLMLACFLVAFQGSPLGSASLKVGLLCVAAACAAVAVKWLPEAQPGAPAATDGRWARNATVALLGSALVLTGARFAAAGLQIGLSPGPVSVGWLVYVVAGAWSSIARGRRWLPYFLVAHVALMVGTLLLVHVNIDVEVFLHDGVQALLSGRNPYLIRIHDPYGPVETARFFGPGVVVGGRLVYGFPYLPSSLLTVVLGYLVGDVRMAHLALLVIVTTMLFRTAQSRTNRALAALVLLSPTTLNLLLSSWTEPTLLLGLALVVVGIRQDRRTISGSGIAALFSAKQYVVVLVPLLLLVARSVGRRTVVVGLAGAALVMLPFFLADPHEMIRSVVDFHLAQPFRADSESLLVLLVRATGWPPAWTFGALPLVAGFAVSTVMARRLPPSASATSLAAGLSLLVTVLLSKQAFVNYYWLIQMSFVLALVMWPVDERDYALVRT